MGIGQMLSIEAAILRVWIREMINKGRYSPERGTDAKIWDKCPNLHKFLHRYSTIIFI
jgi:hypothetical protein